MGASELRVYVPAAEATDELLSVPLALPPDNRWVSTEFGLVAGSLREDALEAFYGEERYLCPRTPRLRMLEGVLAFHNGYAEIGNASIVGAELADRAADELAVLQLQSELEVQILSAQWHVPLRWFLLFDPDQRELFETDEETVVRYRSILSLSMERLAHAIEVIRDVGFDPIADEMEGLFEWLDQFDPSWMVELDYAGVASLFNPVDLAMDNTAEEIWKSVEALGAGDFAEAGHWYQRTVERWSPAVSISYAN
jgi:hypothetical protein